MSIKTEAAHLYALLDNMDENHTTCFIIADHKRSTTFNTKLTKFFYWVERVTFNIHIRLCQLVCFSRKC
jgi:hypothetical protein